MKKLLLFLLPLFAGIIAHADSPITSTEFYKAYLEIPEVAQAHKTGLLDETLAQYLSSPGNTADKKMALINALSWDANGKNNKAIFQKYLQKKYKLKSVPYSRMTADEQLCLGYLAIMDQYTKVVEPLKILKGALARNPKSYTYNMIYGLVLAQMCMEEIPPSYDKEKYPLVDRRFIDPKLNAWCAIYRIAETVDTNKALVRDMKPEARDEILRYMNLYKEYCEAGR